MDNFKYPTAREVVSEFLRQLDEGVEITQEDLLKQHHQLGEELREELRKVSFLVSETSPSNESTNVASARGSDETIIRCPHCNKPTDASLDQSMQVFQCQSCQNNFSLIRERKWPTNINHFELIDRIGLGGFGTVWKARDVELDRLVAIKLPRRSLPDGTAGGQFLKEAKTAARLIHPNIVRVYEVGVFEDEVFIASELIDGESLSKHIGNGLPESEALKIVHQLAKALAYAHQERVIHRDLKPQNVILDRSGKPYLSDFGLAGHMTTDMTLTATGQVLGTPSYMSPEQARGENTDERSDIYSFGVLLYETLTGQVPFQGTLPNVLRRLDEEEPVSVRRINDLLSRDIDTICMKCMEKSPERRYQSANEVASELQCVIDRKPIQARPISPLERSVRWSKRNPMLATLSGIACITLLFAGFLFSSLLAQRKIATVESYHTALAQIKEILAEAKGGYRNRIFEIIDDKQEVLTDPFFHDEFREVAIASMGDFSGFAPLQLPLNNAATAAIDEDGSLVAIGFLDGHIEVRTNSPDWNLQQNFVLTDVQGDFPISLRFPNESSAELVVLTHQGFLRRFTWHGEVQSQLIVRLRVFPEPEEGAEPPGLHCASITMDARRVAFCDATSAGVYDFELKRLMNWELDGLGDATPRCVVVGEASNVIAVGYSDELGTESRLRCWDLADKEFEFEVIPAKGRQYENGLAISPREKYLLLGGEHTTLFELKKGLESRQSFEGSEAAALAFSPNSRLLAICYVTGEVEVRNRKSYAVIANFDQIQPGNRRGVTFSGSGKHMLSWHQNGLQTLYLDVSSERITFAGHQSGVTALRFTSDGTKLISTGKDGHVHRWDSHTGNKDPIEVYVKTPVQCVDLHLSEKWMATAKWGKDPELAIWSYPKFDSKQIVPHDLKHICSMQFSPSSKYFAAIGDNGLQVWNVVAQDGQLTFSPYFDEQAKDDDAQEQNEDEEEDKEELGEPEPGRNGKFLIFDKQEERLYYADNWCFIRWLDLKERETHSFQESESDDLFNGWNSMAFTSEGHLTFVNIDNKLVCWSVNDGAKRDKLIVQLEDTITGSTVTTNGADLLAGTLDGKTVAIWDLKSKKRVHRFRPESSGVYSLAWSPDGNRLAVGLADGGLSVWDLNEIRKQLRILGFRY